jgi:hypothetical protein
LGAQLRGFLVQFLLINTGKANDTAFWGQYRQANEHNKRGKGELYAPWGWGGIEKKQRITAGKAKNIASWGWDRH